MRLGADTAKNYRRAERQRRIRVAGTSAFVVAVLMTMAGFGYTLYISQREAVVVQSASTEKQPKPRFAEPQKPAKNAQIGVSVQMFSSPITVGSTGSMSVKTLPGAACSILFTYNEPQIISKDKGLIPKKADDYGLVDWTWAVTGEVDIGTWPVEVTCSYNDKHAYYRGDLVVQR